MNVSDEALEPYINNLIHISFQTFRNIATWSKQGRQNAKGWTKGLWAEVDTLLARDDPVIAKVIQEAAELSREEGIGRKTGCLLTMNS
jgi:hypothetical protein